MRDKIFTTNFQISLSASSMQNGMDGRECARQKLKYFLLILIIIFIKTFEIHISLTIIRSFSQYRANNGARQQTRARLGRSKYRIVKLLKVVF
jgi:hypothetical protein